MGTGETTGTTGTGTGETTTTSGSSSGSDEGTTDAAPDTCGFICEDDPNTPPDWEGDSCNTFEQNCPGGQKCTTTYMKTVGDFVDHCVDVHPQARWVGEPCEQFGDLGIDGDNCVLGSLCWDPDPITGIGMCVELCGGTENSPVCTTPDTYCANGKSLQLCLQTCEPLDLQTCPVGCICVPVGDTLSCVLDASGELGAYADPCEFANACDAGNICLNPTASPDCDQTAGGCCMPYCDLTAPNCPSPDLECLSLWEEGFAPAGYETLGICVVPG